MYPRKYHIDSFENITIVCIVLENALIKSFLKFFIDSDFFSNWH